jgi:hypothetical protein
MEGHPVDEHTSLNGQASETRPCNGNKDRACCGHHDTGCCGEGHAEEIEVVELVDEHGAKQEFAVLELVEFEGRTLAALAPLAVVQALIEAEAPEGDLDVEIFVVNGDDFAPLEDDAVAERFLAFLDSRTEQGG